MIAFNASYKWTNEEINKIKIIIDNIKNNKNFKKEYLTKNFTKK